MSANLAIPKVFQNWPCVQLVNVAFLLQDLHHYGRKDIDDVFFLLSFLAQFRTLWDISQKSKFRSIS